jgi:hypothetical protein
MKILKTLMNQFTKFNLSSDIILIRLFGLQAYCKFLIFFVYYCYYALLTLMFFIVNELTIYKFKLKYTEVYTTEAILIFPLLKRWADMVNADKAIMGLLKYEVRINGNDVDLGTVKLKIR